MVTTETERKFLAASTAVDLGGEGDELRQGYLAEDRETVADIAGRLGLTFAQVPDRDTAIAAKYRVMGVPALFFIGRDGRIRSIQVGTLTPERIDAALATIR